MNLTKWNMGKNLGLNLTDRTKPVHPSLADLNPFGSVLLFWLVPTPDGPTLNVTDRPVNSSAGAIGQTATAIGRGVRIVYSTRTGWMAGDRGFVLPDSPAGNVIATAVSEAIRVDAAGADACRAAARQRAADWLSLASADQIFGIVPGEVLEEIAATLDVAGVKPDLTRVG